MFVIRTEMIVQYTFQLFNNKLFKTLFSPILKRLSYHVLLLINNITEYYLSLF